MVLFQHTQFLTNLDERGDATIQLLGGVGSAQLNADACLALRNNGIADPIITARRTIKTGTEMKKILAKSGLNV